MKTVAVDLSQVREQDEAVRAAILAVEEAIPCTISSVVVAVLGVPDVDEPGRGPAHLAACVVLGVKGEVSYGAGLVDPDVALDEATRSAILADVPKRPALVSAVEAYHEVESLHSVMGFALDAVSAYAEDVLAGVLEGDPYAGTGVYRFPDDGSAARFVQVMRDTGFDLIDDTTPDCPRLRVGR